MKKKLLFVAVAAIGILVSGCKTNVNPILPESESGTLRVTIKSEKPAVGRASGTHTQEEENTVHSFTVYVFDNTTGELEKEQNFDSETLTGEISGLSTISKKNVVVLVNTPKTPDVSIKTYEELKDQLFDIKSQAVEDFTEDGLFMSGESSDVTLSTTEDNHIEVSVKRIVAKIIFGSLTISGDADPDLLDFTLHGVSIQKTGNLASAFGSLGTDDSNFSWIGGLAGTVSKAETAFLYEELDMTDYTPGETLKPEIFFYVYENSNTADRATTFVLEGSYTNEETSETVTIYYPFQVNTVNIEGGEGSPNGKGIERNMNYTLNVTLKNLDLYTTDPDETQTKAAMEVAVTVADWDGNLVQDEKN